MVERRRRFFVVLAIALFVAGGSLLATVQNKLAEHPTPPAPTAVRGEKTSELALAKLETLPIKGRAAKTGYAREQFAADWGDLGACDVRDYILDRDMTDVKTRSEDDCTVISGALQDPYTNKAIQFTRGADTSSAVQIDHIVALSNAWQTGAQQLDEAKRAEFYNDPLNLLAVDGPTNMKKGDADAATWLPPNKDYRCRYVARQIAVKDKYKLWITQAEHDSIKQVLHACPSQVLPVVE